MPITLPPRREAVDRPQPPRPVVWLSIVVLIFVANVAWVLMALSQHERIDTSWLWLRLLGLPSLAGALAYGLRLHCYEQEMLRLDANDKVEQEDRDSAIQFAREPLAILDTAYVCALGESSAAKVVARKSVLGAKKPAKGQVAIRHTALGQFDQLSLAERYGACFVHLLKQLDDSLKAIPSEVPLAVYIHIPAEVPYESVIKYWHDSWSAAGLSGIRFELLSSEMGVMELDAWLDIRGGSQLERFALFVAVQLHETPVKDSAEAGVALLLGWEPLAVRKQIPVQALLCRPQEVTPGNGRETLHQALLWGDVLPAQVQHLWQAGLQAEDRPVLMQLFSDLSLGLTTDGEVSGLHDIDAAMGEAGVASPWLGIALATEYAIQRRVPQIVVSRETGLYASVVRPVEAEADAFKNNDE